MKWFAFLLLCLSSALFAAEDGRVIATRGHQAIDATAQKMGALKVVPHLSTNEQWRSTAIFRNDTSQIQSITCSFYDQDGSLVMVQFQDSDGETYTSNTFILNLTGFEAYSLEFIAIPSGQRSFQLFAEGGDSFFDYGLEATYNLYGDGRKKAAVGVSTQQPAMNFLMNLDERTDLFTGGRQFRGMAITNNTTTPCDCTVRLFDHGPNGTNTAEVAVYTLPPIPARGKWLGITPDFSFQPTDLPNGIGYFEVRCSQEISALGLSFEEGSEVAGSVPIDYFNLNKNKRTFLNR